MTQRRAHVVVVGNEKGGSGKSTTAMHLISALLRDGAQVASIDLDARQGSLSRYFENRKQFIARTKVPLPMPEHFAVSKDALDKLGDERAREEDALRELILDLRVEFDFLVVDTPGADTHLSRLGHSFADTLVTPMNDSFIDLDLLARVEPETLKIRGPSVYSEMVWEMRKARMERDNGRMDWVVMRNRVSASNARNARDVEAVLEPLSRRLGFRLAPGFGDRMIFRELFLDGVTLLDLRDLGGGFRWSLSHVAARNELRALLKVLGLGASAADAEEDGSAAPMQRTA
ncbi:MAG: division plane positioning ATPase MipZ [Pseudomonadota bacterium]